MVLVERRVSDVIEIVGGGVTENQRLYHRRDEQTHAAARILQYREKLLAGQCQNTRERIDHAVHASVLCKPARRASANAAAIATSTRVFGIITDQTSPARNTLCNSAT